jgi:DNA-directed RNA polymerase sigma subunit (sigma70/sigma32)
MEEDIKEISRRLAKLETHIINLIIPIQGIVECLKSTTDIKYLAPIPINDSKLRMILADFNREMTKFSKDVERFEKMDTCQTFGEIKYIGKRLNEIESTLKKMQSEGIKKNIELEFRCDGYEMVKKPLNYNKEDPIEDPDDNLGRLLATLENREIKVIMHRLGILGEKAKTYEAIGKIIGVSRERVRMIYAKSIRKLRHPSRRTLAEKINHLELRREIFGDEELE